MKRPEEMPPEDFPPEDCPPEAECFYRKYLVFIWIVFALTAATIKYDLSDEMREKIDEVSSVIYDALKEEKKKEQ